LRFTEIEPGPAVLLFVSVGGGLPYPQRDRLMFPGWPPMSLLAVQALLLRGAMSSAVALSTVEQSESAESAVAGME
jgi:hypothetical protein